MLCCTFFHHCALPPRSFSPTRHGRRAYYSNSCGAFSPGTFCVTFLLRSSPFLLTRNKYRPSTVTTHNFIPPVAHHPMSLYKRSQVQLLQPQISLCCLFPLHFPSPPMQDLKGSADLLHTCRTMLDFNLHVVPFDPQFSTRFSLSQGTTRD